MTRDLDALRAAVEAAGAVPREAKGSGEVWRYELDGAFVTAWRTGTVRVQGKDPGRAALEGIVGAPPAAAALPVDLPRDLPWIGVDESGKGDYFGPLVSAAVRVEPAVAEELGSLGVADSKKLSDKRVAALAPHVRALTAWTRTVIAPRRYNELYAEFGSLNRMLGWAHARSIEDLLDAGHAAAYAIVDQFADRRVMERALLRGTRD
ncbi:MAG: hypothetical protein M3389_14855, partial [Actinomycetota bacterium]|nr:hypothetical protein [Actinomycetota bacterium]